MKKLLTVSLAALFIVPSSALAGGRSSHSEAGHRHEHAAHHHAKAKPKKRATSRTSSPAPAASGISPTSAPGAPRTSPQPALTPAPAAAPLVPSPAIEPAVEPAVETPSSEDPGFVEPGITGRVSDFTNCPVNVIVAGFTQFGPGEEGGGLCVHAVVVGGVVQIGHSSVAISVPGDSFDLGGTPLFEGASSACAVINLAECVVSPPHGLLNGPAQPVPGGLLGTVGNVQLTGVSAKLEWAAPVAPDTAFGTEGGCNSSNPLLTLSECRLVTGVSGTAVTLSVKVHLLSPFLGSHCFIGSAAHPIVIPLTTGTTSPPPPAKPIRGKPYEFGVPGAIGTQNALRLLGVTLVSNSFSVPAATDCGTGGGNLLDAAIDHKLGLPSAAGLNMISIKTNNEQENGFGVREGGWTGE